MPKIKAKGVFSAPGDYIYFKSQVPLHKIPVGAKQWRYYDFGPKVVPPLICIPGTAGSADVYYKQIMALSMKGYRVISVDIPRVWNHHEWIHSFEKFLDVVDVHHIHIYGTSLGGFLAQLFAQHRPRRVKSLVLSNTFLDTHTFSAAMPWAPLVSWTPSFLLKRYVLTGIRDGPHEPFIADSVDFVVSQVEALSKDDLASRLTLTSDSASVGPLLLPDSSVTIIDTNDYCATPQQLKDEVSERYPGARRAYLKSGGDFPFLSRPDEVNLHLQLHLRRVGVEPRPDLVRGAPQPTIVGNPYEETWRQSDVYQSKDVGTSKEHQINTEIIQDENDDNPSKNEDQEIEDLLNVTKVTCKDPLEGNSRENDDDPSGDNDGFSRGPSRSTESENSEKKPEVGPESSEDTSKNGESETKNTNESPKDLEKNYMSSFSKDVKSSDFGARLLNHNSEKLVADIIMLSEYPLILVSFVLHTYVSALYISCVHSCRCSRFV